MASLPLVISNYHFQDGRLTYVRSNRNIIRLSKVNTVNSRDIEAEYNEVPAYIEMGLSPRLLNAFIFIPLSENMVISKEYIGPSIRLRYNGS